MEQTGLGSVDVCSQPLELTVVVPVRNAEDMVEACLDSIIRSNPREVVVVDGCSTDRTLDLVRRYPVQVLSDEGRGVAAARMIGARASTTPYVALIDVDIVLPDHALVALLDEFTAGQYVALQAGLRSVSGNGYWGRALVHHHHTGRSRQWPGVMATIFDRQALLDFGFDEWFASGEDIELRWRLQHSGAHVGVSSKIVVTHRYGDTFHFARGQWIADGRGLARMLVKYRFKSSYLLILPLASAIWGLVVSFRQRQVGWIPYYLCYAGFNYLAMVGFLAHYLKNRTVPVAE